MSISRLVAVFEGGSPKGRISPAGRSPSPGKPPRRPSQARGMRLAARLRQHIRRPCVTCPIAASDHPSATDVVASGGSGALANQASRTRCHSRRTPLARQSLSWRDSHAGRKSPSSSAWSSSDPHTRAYRLSVHTLGMGMSGGTSTHPMRQSVALEPTGLLHNLPRIERVHRRTLRAKRHTCID